ncbi:MAG: PaaI family thioesterase [Burkholderiaceae bacterium]
MTRICASAGFNRWAGFEVLRASADEVELAMPWRDEAGQYSGFLHAGLIGALLDTVSGFAAGAHTGRRVMASHFAVNCLAPAIGRRFVARGRVLKAGRKQIFARAELHAYDGDVNDGEESGQDAGKLVATGEVILVPVAG